MEELIRIAMEWRDNGYSVVPIEHGGKRPLVKWSSYANEPAPIRDIIRWFRNDLNIAVLCGGKNNLAVVDFDTQDGYYKALSRIDERLCGIINRTYKVKTGRGVHAYFNIETRSRKNVDMKIDVKGSGGYVIAPPSLHPSGRRYEAMPGSCISQIQPITSEELCALACLDKDEPEQVVEHNDSCSSFDITPDEFGFVDDFSHVLSHVSILRVALRLTPMFQKTSRYWMGVCPVHKDTSPSFWVDTELGIAKCYSTACVLNDKAVNAIGLWSIANNMTYAEAMHDLLKMI